MHGTLKKAAHKSMCSSYNWRQKMRDKYSWQYEEDDGNDDWLAFAILAVILLAGGGLITLITWLACT